MSGMETADSAGGRRAAVAAAEPLVWLCAGLVVVSAAGCTSNTWVYLADFSPDSRSLVYTREDGWFFGIPMMGPPVLGMGSYRGKLCCLDVTQPEAVHRVPIGGITLGPFSRPPEEIFHRDMHPVFSPDSQYVAQVQLTSGDILIVSRDGKDWKLPEAHDVRCLTWVSSEEVAYAEIVRKKREHGLEFQALVVWRQGVLAPHHRRELCRREAHSFKCHFSPSPSSSLLLREYDRADRYWLVDLASGQMVDLGPDGGALRSVAWSIDGSKLLLATDDPNSESLPSGALRFVMHYTVLDTQTERRAAWSETYETTGGDTWFALASLWTADDRYVVLGEYARGWSLVDPWSQERVGLSEKLAPHLEQVNADKVFGVSPLPVEGWLWVNVQLREPRGAQRVFAMDYGGEHFVPLADGRSWAVSPDATYVAEGNEQGGVDIRRLALPGGE